MFYQLCDLDVGRYSEMMPVMSPVAINLLKVVLSKTFFTACLSIKEVIEQNSGKEETCDERDGWCVLGTTDKLRDIISAMIKKVIRAQKPGMENNF